MKTISLHILDIVQNSITAGANIISVTINEQPEENIFELSVLDNGCGMDCETLKNIVDPFFTSRTTRKVGLGLPLLKQNAERTGGNLQISSEINTGTCVACTFIYNHIDRPVLGDIAGTISLLITTNPDIAFVYEHYLQEKSLIFSSDEFKCQKEYVNLSQLQLSKNIKEIINTHLENLKIKNMTFSI